MSGMRTGYHIRLNWGKEVMLPPNYLPQALLETHSVHRVKKCHQRLDPWDLLKKRKFKFNCPGLEKAIHSRIQKDMSSHNSKEYMIF
jgi:hypothetical protein